MKFTVAASAVAALLTASSSVEGRKTIPKWLRHTYNEHNAIPLDSGRDWITLPNGMEYQPGPIEDEVNDVRMANIRARSLGYTSNNYNDGYQRGAYNDRKSNNYNQGDANAMTTPYIDGSESYYDEYAQAWRVLGWYIDCDSMFMSRVNAYNNGYNNNNNQDADKDDNDIGCQRYLLWASVRVVLVYRVWRKTHNHPPSLSLGHACPNPPPIH